jgi:hypothetical protein
LTGWTQVQTRTVVQRSKCCTEIVPKQRRRCSCFHSKKETWWFLN